MSGFVKVTLNNGRVFFEEHDEGLELKEILACIKINGGIEVEDLDEEKDSSSLKLYPFHMIESISF